MLPQKIAEQRLKMEKAIKVLQDYESIERLFTGIDERYIRLKKKELIEKYSEYMAELANEILVDSNVMMDVFVAKYDYNSKAVIVE